MRDFDLPGDEPDGQDLAGQLVAERSAREKAEQELAALRAKQGAASTAQAGGQPPAVAGPGAVPGDPPAGLLDRLRDRSVDWPTLQQEMAAAGFTGGGPQPSTVGMRPR